MQTNSTPGKKTRFFNKTALFLVTLLVFCLLSFYAIPAPPEEGTPPPPNKEAFLTLSLSFYAGEPHDLAAYIDENCRGYSLRTDNPAVLEVTADGRATGLSPGEATVLLEAEGYTGALLVRVAENPTQPGLYFEEDYYLLAPGERLVPSYTCYPQKEGIRLSLSESAAVKLEGKELTGVSRGSALLTVSDGERSDACLICVASASPYAPLGPLPPLRYREKNGVLAFSGGGEEAVLLLGGDLMCLSAQQSAARSGGTYDYTYAFSEVKDIFAESDFAMANLETCLSYSSAYTIADKGTATSPHCNAQATYLYALRYAGLDGVATANNHCADTGVTGLLETLSLIDEYGLAHTGTFSREGEARYLLTDISGIRVAFLSYTNFVNKGFPAEYQALCLNLYSAEKAAADIAAAREAGAEYVVVYMHWGSENTHQVNSRQREQARELGEAGADFIAGSHPHCLQEGEVFFSTGGREVTVIYSMGNLLSSMPRVINNDAVLLRLVLARTQGGVVLAEQSYIPLRVGALSGRRFVLCPAAEDSAAAGRIRAILGGTFSELIWP